MVAGIYWQARPTDGTGSCQAVLLDSQKVYLTNGLPKIVRKASMLSFDNDFVLDDTASKGDVNKKAELLDKGVDPSPRLSFDSSPYKTQQNAAIQKYTHTAESSCISTQMSSCLLI